eukprot:Skav222869  [mRNA]  locus=scaffold2201:367669:368988:+ [translate_table: standard]
MSALEAAFKERKEKLLEDQALQQRAKLRNVADPLISVEQIQSAFSGFMSHKKSNDLWRLVSPPASLSQVTWQSPPSGPWMIKVAHLAFDIFQFAPNTKLLGVKVKQALHALLLQKNLSLPQNMGSTETVLDKIDLCLRIVLNQFKETKLKPNWKSKLYRSMPRDDQIILDMVLEKIQLPQDGFSGSSGSQMGSLQGEEDLGGSLDLVPLPAPEPLLALQDGSPESSTTQAPLKRLKNLVPEAVDQVMGEAPKIFDKILKGTSQFFKQLSVAPAVPAASVPKSKAGTGFDSDEELLQAAQQFAPKPALSQGKPSKQAPTAMAKAPKKKKAKTKAKAPAKKPQAKAKAKAKSKGKKKQQPASEDLEDSHGQSEDQAKIPEFKIEPKPRDTDTYKNKYCSRQHHKAYEERVLMRQRFLQEGKLQRPERFGINITLIDACLSE